MLLVETFRFWNGSHSSGNVSSKQQKVQRENSSVWSDNLKIISLWSEIDSRKFSSNPRKIILSVSDTDDILELQAWSQMEEIIFSDTILNQTK